MREGSAVGETEEGATCQRCVLLGPHGFGPQPHGPGTASSPAPARRVCPESANHFLLNSRITFYLLPLRRIMSCRSDSKSLALTSHHS